MLMPQRLVLQRTFSAANDAATSLCETTNPYTDDSLLRSLDRPGSGENFRWEQLLEHRVVVILGEAGVGKTCELQNRIDRLRETKYSAFFVPLNLALDERALTDLFSEAPNALEPWLACNEPGYFFLDAVDEARLKSHADLESALLNIIRQAKPALGRATFVLSSRPSDWYTPSVQEIVRRVICQPVQAQVGAKATGMPVQGATESKVFALDPLSPTEARRLASFFGVTDVDAFWKNVEREGYEFMAGLPLDLKWMSEAWNAQGRLGGLTEMLENSLRHRFLEVNPTHSQSGHAVPPSTLREGAELLAVACVLSGRSFIATPGDSASPSASSNDTVAADVLTDWKPITINTLLSTAIFDEASYGRVRFHHRTVREYLAASWISQRMDRGLPLEDATKLFINQSLGEPVCIPSRRPVLAWLASMQPQIREWVIADHPDVTFLGGDAEVWSEEDVAKALRAYRHRSQPAILDWPHDPATLARIGRRAGPDFLNELLRESATVPSTILRLLPIVLVRYAALKLCADAVFRIYEDNQADRNVRGLALATLGAIATPAQRERLRQDLLSGQYTDNGMRANACAALFPEHLTVEELLTVLRSADRESSHIGGVLRQCIRNEILPRCDVATATALLDRLLAILPSPQVISAADWLHSLLPDVFLVALPQSPTDEEKLDVLHRAAVYLDILGRRGLWSIPMRARIQANIDEAMGHLPASRRALALSIAESAQGNPDHVAGPRPDSVVKLLLDDLPWVETSANDPSLPPQRRHVAFVLLVTMGRQLKACERWDLVRKAIKRCDGKERLAIWRSTLRDERETSSVSHRESAARRQYHTTQEQERTTFRRWLEDNQNAIRDGQDSAILFRAAQYLPDYSSNTLSAINVPMFVKAYGTDLWGVVAAGLKHFWRQVEPPLPREIAPNLISDTAKYGLIGIMLDVNDGFDIASDSSLAGRLARYALWELNGAPPWFNALATKNPQPVADAIWTAVKADLIAPSADNRQAKALDIASEGPLALKTALAARLCTSVDNNPELWINVQSHTRLRTALEILRSTDAVDNAYLAKQIVRVINAAADESSWMAVGYWLAFWLQAEPDKAWSLFEKLWSSVEAQSQSALVQVVNGMAKGTSGGVISNFGLLGHLPETPEAVSVLERMVKFFESHIVREQDVHHAAGAAYELGARDVAQEIRDSLPTCLRMIPGAAAHEALKRLSNKYQSTPIGRSLSRLLHEHALEEAERTALLRPQDIPSLGEIHRREPRSEGELFQVALARLQTIKQGIETGPFSERELFSAEMEERKLQLWLAARLHDTPGRRFSVSREDEVDTRKEPDIHIHHAVGKVCIEVKPLDTSRYSGNELTEALEDQLVGRYLGGLNSHHGILVLFLLKEGRSWQLPGNQKANFQDLLAFLQDKADNLRQTRPGVSGLQVFGVDCTGHHSA
ncbi:MAG: NACHT domain-containing protein [Acidiferrobacterales bacterium]